MVVKGFFGRLKTSIPARGRKNLFGGGAASGGEKLLLMNRKVWGEKKKIETEKQWK